MLQSGCKIDLFFSRSKGILNFGLKNGPFFEQKKNPSQITMEKGLFLNELKRLI